VAGRSRCFAFLSREIVLPLGVQPVAPSKPPFTYMYMHL
jgi:hypothetical protein